MTINEKIGEIRKLFCGGDNKKFAEMLDLSPQYASNICKEGKSVGESQKLHILSVFPNVSKSWLFADEGEMLKEQKTEQNSSTEVQLISPSIENYKLVPLYNMDARGGFGANDEVDCAEYIMDHIPFKDAKSDDICVPVSGKSMMPTYCPGTVVLLHEIENWSEFLETGQIYVLILKDGRRLLKELRRSEEDRKANYLCVSHNPDYEPVELPRKLIHRVYLVTAMYQKTTI